MLVPAAQPGDAVSLAPLGWQGFFVPPSSFKSMKEILGDMRRAGQGYGRVSTQQQDQHLLLLHGATEGALKNSNNDLVYIFLTKLSSNGTRGYSPAPHKRTPETAGLTLHPCSLHLCVGWAGDFGFP